MGRGAGEPADGQSGTRCTCRTGAAYASLMHAGQQERIGRLLDEMAAEAGPIPAELIAEARLLWRPQGPVDEGAKRTGASA